MAEALTEHLKWVDSVEQLPIIPALFVFSTCVHMEMWSWLRDGLMGNFPFGLWPRAVTAHAKMRLSRFNKQLSHQVCCGHGGTGMSLNEPFLPQSEGLFWYPTSTFSQADPSSVTGSSVTFRTSLVFICVVKTPPAVLKSALAYPSQESAWDTRRLSWDHECVRDSVNTAYPELIACAVGWGYRMWRKCDVYNF